MKISLLEKDAKYVWHPFTQMQKHPTPLVIERAKGTVLYAEDGKEYLDCNSSWWVNIHGHGHPAFKKAMIRQYDQLDHVLFAGVTHPKAVELAENIIQLMPPSISKVFFSDNGSTAIEVALKMAIQYWYNKGTVKTKIVALDGAYHGDTFGAMSVSQRDYFNEPFENLFFQVDYIDFPFENEEERVLKQASKIFKKKDVAALILEPLIQGSSGMRTYSSTFLNKLMQLAKENNVLIILDEIMTGFGRTGSLFAFNQVDTEPDIVCLSKGLTGGIVPLGLTVTTNDIFDAFLSDETQKAFLHGHSFTAYALACAIACANIELIKKPKFSENILRIQEKHGAFKTKIEKNPFIREVRHLGSIIAIELIDQTEKSYFASIRDTAYYFFLNEGLLIRPCGNVIFLNPPITTKNKELKKMYAGIEKFLKFLTDK